MFIHLVKWSTALVTSNYGAERTKRIMITPTKCQNTSVHSYYYYYKQNYDPSPDELLNIGYSRKIESKFTALIKNDLSLQKHVSDS